jgi:signal peptidase I
MPLRILRSLVWLFLAAGVLVGVARLTMLRWWQVPVEDADLGASVAPTLWPGDWVILWRLSPPGFGDLVLCPDPDEPGQPVIGRIIGEAGDALLIKDDGQLEVNGIRILSEQACRPREFTVPDPSSGEPRKLNCELELVGGVSHKRGTAGATVRPNAREVAVPEGHVFLVSDNRQYPFDSRHFGALERQSCKERVLFRLVSHEGFFDVERRLTLIH